jgi:predicted amidohydrolase
MSISIPGKETQMLGEVAKRQGIYIAAHAWEEYPDFPGRPFSVGFVVSPDGEVILKHHKVVTTKLVESGSTSPSDAWDWFKEKFGDTPEALFPVAETEIGNLGFLICGEAQYPEIARGLVNNGAEIIIRPNAWSEPLMSPENSLMEAISRFIAWSNTCYVAEANSSYNNHPAFPQSVGAGQSAIYDYAGRVLSKATSSAESFTCAEVNLSSLRKHRLGLNTFARTVYAPNQLLRKAYESDLWPLNSLMDKESSNGVAEWEGMRQEIVARRKDIFKS